MDTTAKDVLGFWRDAGAELWFRGGEQFDQRCREHLLEAHMAASRCELAQWGDSADSALALVLLLDQIPRNVFRGSAHAYATDPMAYAVAERAVGHDFDDLVDADLRKFFYLPFVHCESILAQDRAVELHQTLDEPDAGKWPIHHRSIIQQFGRFPHRNRVLGRTTTPVEQAWLDDGGFSG